MAGMLMGNEMIVLAIAAQIQSIQWMSACQIQIG
jgi:hypothetical protein